MSERAFLPDVNILIALSTPNHAAHDIATAWHGTIGHARFLLCAITEAGFVRLMANPAVGGESMSAAMLLLQRIRSEPGVGHLEVARSWLEFIRPFAGRLHGYRQVTDALLLGLAIQSDAILVTLDRRIETLAGEQFASHLLALK